MVAGKADCSWGRCEVNFQLLNVYEKTVLLDQQLKVAKENFRTLAHHSSDMIYQKLIGLLLVEKAVDTTSSENVNLNGLEI